MTDLSGRSLSLSLFLSLSRTRMHALSLALDEKQTLASESCDAISKDNRSMKADSYNKLYLE